MTKAEEVLWEVLRGNKLNGHKFRRQHPIGLYIVDFYNHKNNLVVEVDGDYHDTEDQKLKDIERTKFLEFNGLKVIRFKNDDVLSDLSFVLEKIQEELSS
jgi:very-short-patch-repair endonuclease